MFSDELEMLIDAAIADGEISEKERAILHKRAQAEGVDTDELDMIVDARIAKAKNAANASEKTQVSSKETKPEGPTAAELLQIKIDIINNYHQGKGDEIFDNRIILRAGSKIEDIKHFQRELDYNLTSNNCDRIEAIRQAIINIHVPNEGHELMDMILLCKKSFEKRYKILVEGSKMMKEYDPSRWDSINTRRVMVFSEWNRLDEAYYQKGREVKDRIKNYFPNNPQLMDLAMEVEKLDNDFDKLSNDLDKLREEKKAEFEEQERMKNPINKLKKLFGK